MKHDVSTTNRLFHVKRRTGWLSCGGMVFENCFHPIVVEESVFHVKHGGMAELWGRQFEKYHFSPTRYRGVSVSRETWVRDVLGLGRCVYGKLGCFVLFGFMVMWWFHVEHGQCL